MEINLLHKEINIDAARLITNCHEAIRQAIEEQIGDTWRVVKIEEKSVTCYESTLDTRTLPHPRYILSEATGRFEIELIENQPRDMVLSDGERLQRALDRVRLTAELIYNGKILITNIRFIRLL